MVKDVVCVFEEHPKASKAVIPSGVVTVEGCRQKKGKVETHPLECNEVTVPRSSRQSIPGQPGSRPRTRPRGPEPPTLIPGPVNTTTRRSNRASGLRLKTPKKDPEPREEQQEKAGEDAEVLARDGTTYDLRRSRAVRRGGRSCSPAVEPRPRPRDLDLQRSSVARSASVIGKGTAAGGQPPAARTARTARTRSTRTAGAAPAEDFHPDSNGDAHRHSSSWSEWLSRKREEERQRKEVQRRQDALEEQRLEQDRQFERECAHQNYRLWLQALQAKMAQRRREQLLQPPACPAQIHSKGLK